MGGQQSRPADCGDEKAVERLRKLNVQDDGDYVQVDGGEEKAVMGKSGVPALVRQPEGISIRALEAYIDNVLRDSKNKLAINALSSGDPRHALASRKTKIADKQVFNVKIPIEGGPITNQRSSGRCWLFAATNVFRVALMKRHNVEAFELSQAYLFYWDKLEKSNYFLEQMIDTAGEGLDSRVVATLMGDLVSDGGQWDMVYNLVDKYGLVPQAVYPDSWSAMNSGVLNAVVKTKLREFGLRLRRLAAGEAARRDPRVLAEAKAGMIREVSLILTVLLGPPPKPSARFTWEYVDRDGRARSVAATPRDFARDVYSAELRISAATIEGMVSLVNDPRNAYLSRLTVSRLGNVVGGRPISYVNVDMATIRAACVAMLRAGQPVFFGSDVGKFSDNGTGIMDLELYDYEAGLDTSLWRGMTKAERLMTGESQMTHAMVLTAVHLNERTGRPLRWKVQNSWGAGNGEGGWFLMTDAWMDEFVYQAVVDPRFCPKEVRDVLKQEPIVLPPWDPMGALA
ncbi:Cysteine proteinase 1 [Escovopsis weberi]|uniref:Cysteine proteinase 1, mitochondrial n=1 Tax=Escovopsis weberi TaxID=150374 RepID=A0A0M8N8A3_ESCWE|nr:Cysteine proteinase 1 [Escovopsis weberi]